MSENYQLAELLRLIKKNSKIVLIIVVFSLLLTLVLSLIQMNQKVTFFNFTSYAIVTFHPDLSPEESNPLIEILTSNDFYKSINNRLRISNEVSANVNNAANTVSFKITGPTEINVERFNLALERDINQIVSTEVLEEFIVFSIIEKSVGSYVTTKKSVDLFINLLIGTIVGFISSVYYILMGFFIRIKPTEKYFKILASSKYIRFICTHLKIKE